MKSATLQLTMEGIKQKQVKARVVHPYPLFSISFLFSPVLESSVLFADFPSWTIMG